ncbi:hypothetical protein [Devosia sp.]|uniref:hypothetical protein n=1 Tax=Devosia sp. TaxID=1871048 RepID=UPI002AFE7979|nr:hypothetical protein [Devosia sp.]
MHIKAIASAATLAVVLGFAGTAAAQTMIGNQTVSEADHERVKNYCEDLKTADNQAVSSTESDETAAADEGTEATETAAIGSVDLDQVTLENCIEAGFVTK